MELKDFDIKAFGDSRLLSVTHKKEFAKEVCKSLFLFNKGKTKVVVYTSKDINDSIVQYKNE
jgi:ABC-type polysaccharide/polyol phosphate transport system ATPase subunit